MAIEDDGRIFIPNAKKILEILEKLKSFRVKTNKMDKEKEEQSNEKKNLDDEEQENNVIMRKNIMLKILFLLK